ncbi:MAG: DUF1512 family protein [Candidatus Korarchaeota archaeon]
MVELWGQDLQSIILNMVFMLVYLYAILKLGPYLQMKKAMSVVQIALAELDKMRKETKSNALMCLRKYGRPSTNINKEIEDLIGFFTIEPVDKDPVGVLRRLEHILDTRRNVIRSRIKSAAKDLNKQEISFIEMSIEVAMALEYLFRVVRHYYISARESDNIYLLLQLQIIMPDIMKIAKAYYNAQLHLSKGIPIGDSAGPMVVELALSQISKRQQIDLLENYSSEEIVMRKIRSGNRTLYVIRAEGPSAFVGKPGEIIKQIIQTYAKELSAVLMIDAALALEGEKSGDIAHGVGAVIGDPGPEKYKIEEACANNNIPIVGLVVKMSLAEALSPMSRDVLNGVRAATEEVLDFIHSQKEDASILIAGIGNTIGIGYTIGGSNNEN